MPHGLMEMCCFNLLRLEQRHDNPVLELAINGLVEISNGASGRDLQMIADLILLRMEEEARKLEDARTAKDRDDRLRAEHGIFG